MSCFWLSCSKCEIYTEFGLSLYGCIAVPCYRFTVELPPGLLQRNAELGDLIVPPTVQTREQIETIVKEARIMQTMVRELLLTDASATRHLPHHSPLACAL